MISSSVLPQDVCMIRTPFASTHPTAMPVALRGDHARSIPGMDAAGPDAANAVVTSTLQLGKCPSPCLGGRTKQRQSRVEAETDTWRK